MQSNSTFSTESIAEIRNHATNLADRHRRHSEAIGTEVELIDRLLAHHLSGAHPTKGNPNWIAAKKTP